MYVVAFFIVVGFIGLKMDLATRRKQQKSCRHNWSKWEYEYETYNDKDVYRRNCEKCRSTEFTVSRLTPED